MLLTPLSKSTWSNFEKCPWKAHAHKNLRIKSESSLAAEIGVKTHELIAGVLKGEIPFEEIDLYAETPEIADLAKAAFTLFPDPELEEEEGF
jgi:cytochrome c556